jgi:molybdate transport system substrate-binding protein
VGSSIGVAIKKGAPKPDLSSADAFKKTLLAAKSIGYVEQGATGAYLKQLFAKLGVTEAVASKVVLLPSTNPSAKAVGNGEAEIGMTQISEILPYAATADLAGPLPAEVQQVTLFTAGISAATKDAAAAQALVTFLKSPAAATVLKAKGLDPK